MWERIINDVTIIPVDGSPRLDDRMVEVRGVLAQGINRRGIDRRGKAHQRANFPR
jgi:hypothetical protein